MRKPGSVEAEPRRQKPSLKSEVARLKSQLENARLQQQAGAEILRAVADAAGDVAGPLQLIAETTARLFGATSVSIQLAEGREFTQEYRVGAIAKRVGSAYPRSNIKVGGRNLPGTVVAENRQIHIPDLDHLDPSMSDFPGLPHARAGGARTVCGTPLRREGRAIGALIVFRDQLKPFTDDELALQQSFADQAVIAVENARLFKETKLALERQTATAEILKVIASSPGDVQPVFDAIASSARRLIGGFSTAVHLVIDDMVHLVAFTPTNPEADAILVAAHPRHRSEVAAVALVENGEIAQIADSESADPHTRQLGRARGWRSLTLTPLMNQGKFIGFIASTRRETGVLGDHHVELLRTFADQAVIAIENARLFEEVQAKTRDLTEALQQQTATADVLKVISRSAFDLQTVLETLSRSAVELSGALNGIIFLRDGDVFRYRASSHGDSNPEWVRWLEEHPQRPGRNTATARAIATGKVACVEDVAADPEVDLPATPLAGIRAALSVPLLRDGKVEGVMTLTRQVPGPFTDRQIELVQTFADQAVIAIENVRLFEEVQARTRELAKSLEDLRTAQDRLVQTEKLASLGQLTAGIAHEIKNPLNFVNNFSALSVELTDELNDLLKGAKFSEDMSKEVDELTSLLKDNLGRVVQHGKRADSIVKNMLLHSREGSGEHRPSDVNALVEESLNLAYHGARAEKSHFNVTIERDLDPEAGKIEVFPQEITRVLLNLISNGFYAVSKRKAENGDSVFAPVLKAVTRGLPAHIEIRIRDNGTGIPPEVKEKIFNPFFTTKPAGEGTGLGLSMSHDIVVKQHGGTIDVETVPGEFTEFTIRLPRTSDFKLSNRG
ncbi:MAG TPA: GAF domain-containing protein [Bradyrhizobium sp.]|nr:GAF domain-containing protein [Bradyrhizobium sp.]